MLIISFDAVGDDEVGHLLEYPAFAALYKQSAAYRGVSSVYISNTYPVHASLVTGAVPREHGLISNVLPFPSKHPLWNAYESGMRAKTLWQAAALKGIDTAAVLWPVTAYSKTIRWNIPEILAPHGKSQVVTSMKAGSKLLQFKMLMRRRKLLGDGRQPKRDAFAAACTADILREHNPGLALVHLSAYDSLCHKYGKGSADLEPVFESMDKNLATILDAAGDDRDVLLFSDHGQINVHTEITPNDLLVGAGLLRRESGVYFPGDSGCFFECCGGSAFFHAGSLPQTRINEMRGSIMDCEGFDRFLTEDEMSVSGYESVAFGFSAKPGFSYEAFDTTNKSQHGYPLDTPGYSVFYLARGFGLEPGSVTQGGSLLDIAPLAARRLGVEL